MEILATCSLEECEKYKGKLVVEDPEYKKPLKVILNVRSDQEIAVERLSKSVKCVTLFGEGKVVGKLPDGVDVFREVSLDDIGSAGSVEGETLLVNLPDGYCDMKTLWEMSQGRAVRFIGGNLLRIDGVGIGRYDTGKDKASPVFNGIYDSFLEANLSELGNLQEKIKKVAKKEKSEKRREKKERVKKKKEGSGEGRKSKTSGLKNALNNLFGDSGGVSF